MRTAIAAGLVLAVCFVAPSLVATSLVTPSFAAPENPIRPPAAASAKQRAARPLKPTWEQCFDMSINRGFNHDIEEWHQSIEDCMDGKIPL